MKVAYFDCYSGISGDMILGALVDAGLPLERLKETLSLLEVEGYSITAEKVKRKGIAATKVDVVIEKEDLPGRELKDIRRIISDSELDVVIKEKGLSVFERLARAEATVHNVDIKDVHFHEIAHIDTIIDVVGCIYGLNYLGIERIYSSPVDTGSGMVDTSHGILPVPAPVTAELLRNVPVYSSGVKRELTTPTGAALITTLTTEFQTMPRMRINSIGYGAGSWNLDEQANVLRIFIGEEDITWSTEEIFLLETNIDDMNPQIYEYLMETLFRAGAMDVYITPVIMKKGRPGHVLSVMSSQEKIHDLQSIIFKETSTIGIRVNRVSRSILRRDVEEVETPFGMVKVKKSCGPDGHIRFSPEYEDCKRIAREKGVPLAKVMEIVRRELV